MISVENVGHHFGVRPVLQDVCFSVPQWKTLAIIGPNGTGKTTLLNIVAGLFASEAGTVSIGGHTRRSTLEEELAVRQQTFFLPAELWFPKGVTVRQYLLSVGELWGRDPLRLFEHADRLLKLFQLEELSNGEISAGSTGQQKKVALCSALIAETPVLLLDEPFSGGLDPAGLTAMKQVLKHLTNRDDRTVVISSPVPELVEEVADDVLILKDGLVLRHASVSDIKAESECSTLAEALSQLVFPETAADLAAYFQQEATT